jgi:hypothetical protein
MAASGIGGSIEPRVLRAGPTRFNGRSRERSLVFCYWIAYLCFCDSGLSVKAKVVLYDDLPAMGLHLGGLFDWDRDSRPFHLCTLWSLVLDPSFTCGFTTLDALCLYIYLVSFVRLFVSMSNIVSEFGNVLIYALIYSILSCRIRSGYYTTEKAERVRSIANLMVVYPLVSKFQCTNSMRDMH